MLTAPSKLQSPKGDQRKYAESGSFTKVLCASSSFLSGRRLAYVKPRIGTNQFGGESVTYEGVGPTKKWGRIESYGPKFVENIVQAISRDILCYAMNTLRHCLIVGHVHDERIIECDPRVDLKVVCEQMGQSSDWMPDILLRADGYETQFYMKD